MLYATKQFVPWYSQSAETALCSGWEQLKSIIPFGAARKPSDASTGPEEDRSFTLVFIGNSTMHLAVKGNGRSRNEWVAAFSDLASGLYADILKPDEPTGKAE